MGYYNFYFLLKKLKKLKKYKKLIFIIFLLVFLLNLCNSCFCAVTEDIATEIFVQRDSIENRFVNFCYYHFINNTNYWQNILEPFISNIIEHNYCTYISGSSRTNNTVSFSVGLYTNSDIHTINSNAYNFITADNGSYMLDTYIFPANYKRIISYNTSTGTGSISQSSEVIELPVVCFQYRSTFLSQFLNDVQTNSINYSNYLNNIESYLNTINNSTNSIDSNIGTIISDLNLITQTLNTFVSNFPNYSTQITNISGGISSILQDNQDIINQNSSMVQEQQEINNNLDNVNNNLTNLNDNLMDDNFDNSNLNLPTNNTQNTADGGINNIFTNMYNAFCTGTPQNIVFPVPFTNKNITIEPDFLYNSLYNSNGNWLILFIQAFWGYLIGRFVVLDVNDKFNKIKSGNIENLENSNIKGELL